jgi:hypothetical protein
VKRITGIDPTGSTLDRAAICPPSIALPQIFTEGEPDDARAKGSSTHEFLKRVSDVGRDAALAETDEIWRDRCASINVAKLADRLKLSTEVALAYNWREDTARLLEPVAPRVYEIDVDSEIAATGDVVAYDPKKRRAYAGDYKGPRAWLPKPDQSMQLGLEAVALARIYGADEAQLEYIRILDDGEQMRFDATLDAFGIENAAARIRETMELVTATRDLYERGIVPNVTEGRHCKYCPARMHCPAKTAGMRAVLAQPAVSMREPITPGNAATVYAAWREARDRMSQIEAAIYSYAKTTSIPIGQDDDGSVRYFGELTRDGNDRLDGAIAHRVLVSEFGGEVANATVSMEVTKTAIAGAIAANLKDGETKAGKMRDIVAKIEAAGGVSNPSTTTTTEFTVAKDGAAKARKRKAA